MRRDKNFRIDVSASGEVKRQGRIDEAHVHAILQNQADLRRQLSGVLDATSTENRAQTANERAQVSAITRELDALGQAHVHATREQDEMRAESAIGPRSVAATSPTRRYADLFPTVRRDMGGFASSEEFLATIHSGLADPRLMATNTGGSPSEGGFSVPTEVFSQWLDGSLENEIVRSRADVRPMLSSDAAAPAWDDGNHSSTLFGGFGGAWVAEGADITVETPKMRLLNLKARKLAILARVSNELVADGQGFDSQLGAAIQKALGWFLDTGFLSGAGAPGPQGIIGAPCTITVAKETAQAAATIAYENLTKMFSRLHPGSMANAVWVVNSTAIPQLLQLSVSIGTAGSHIPVLTESSGQFRMLTLPVIFTEKVPTLGTVGDILLADFSQYVIGLRADFSLAKSSHAGFASDTAFYRGVIRVEGQPKLSAPITPLYGNTLSHFVTLATRA